MQFSHTVQFVFVFCFFCLYRCFLLLLRLCISRRNWYQHIKHEKKKKEQTNSNKKGKNITT